MNVHVRTMCICKAVNYFSIIACVKYSIVTSHVHLHLHLLYCIGKIYTDITPTNLWAKWEDYMKAWNCNEIDFDQKMGHEYSTIVQINMKADCRKAIVWWSVSCKIISYHIPDKKFWSLQFTFCILSTFCIWSAVCSLHLVLTGISGTNTCVWVNWTFLLFSASILFFPFVKRYILQ